MLVTVQVTDSFIGTSITNVVDASALLKVQGEEKEVTDDDDEVTPLEPTLDVGAFEPVCVGDFPYIGYTIVPKGFTPAGSATIEILDADMQLVETLNDQPLSGQILWPGASLDPADWPGWQLENGVWVEDETDQFLREGLFFRVTVNPTATTALVPYPEATEACADPAQTSADLEILKAATAATVPQGSTFEWILEVINNGPDLATEIVVTDNVPANLRVDDVRSNTFDCTRQGNAVTCTLDELAVGASAFIGIDVTVPIGTEGNISNTADVSGRVPDPNPNNNSDNDVVNVPTGVLPDTGSDMGNTLRTAGLILTAGLALVVLALRRRREQVA
ncbi:MAG: DUF11 domain-containing protein [Ilumatobacteraceae bacterium]|nr:DUF11 domain-containing protein [Ilumatobacteraceae bacterium]